MSSKESMMHAKLYMFSTAGSTKLVSMIGSSNIASSATTGSWNNIMHDGRTTTRCTTRT